MTQQDSRMMSERIEHRRQHDDELLGFLVPASGERFTPVTVFGYPITEPTDRNEAEESLDRLGLSYLAERWTFEREDQEPIQVEIVEASPERVVVKSVDFGSELEYGTRFTLNAPVDKGRLRLR